MDHKLELPLKQAQFPDKLKLFSLFFEAERIPQIFIKRVKGVGLPIYLHLQRSYLERVLSTKKISPIAWAIASELAPFNTEAERNLDRSSLSKANLSGSLGDCTPPAGLSKVRASGVARVLNFATTGKWSLVP